MSIVLISVIRSLGQTGYMTSILKST